MVQNHKYSNKQSWIVHKQVFDEWEASAECQE